MIRDNAGNGSLNETRIAMFVQSIAEIVRQQPRGISEEELLDIYSVHRDREYVEEALTRAIEERLVVCRGEKLYSATSVWRDQ